MGKRATTTVKGGGKEGERERGSEGWNGTWQKPPSARKIEDSEQNRTEQNRTGGKSIVVDVRATAVGGLLGGWLAWPVSCDAAEREAGGREREFLGGIGMSLHYNLTKAIKKRILQKRLQG